MTNTAAPDGNSPRFTTIQWLICIIAAIGFAFDTYELLMLPLLIRPALEQLGGLQFGSPGYSHWRDLMFYVPAICGGIFGLLGGYLTDLLGRRRVLTWSILLYALSAFAAGFSTSLPMLLVLRSTKFIGVCVEFVAAVAWLAELFTEPKRREQILGWTQAFSSLGGFMVSLMALWIAKIAPALPAIHGGHDNWRYLLISGIIPALPLIIIRPFLPESPVWAEKKAAGTLRRPALGEIFKPAYKLTTLVAALLFACSLGAAFGAIQQLPQLVPALVPPTPGLPPPQRAQLVQSTVAGVQTLQELGGLAGRILLAFLAVRIASRQKLLRLFLLPGLVIVPLVFFFPAVSNLALLKWGIFFAGLCTVAQLSFWGNYLPRVYPVHLRGTGESFAANIGGRMIGTSAALLTTQLALQMPGTTPNVKLAYAAGGVALLVYAVALLASFWLPEPPKEELAE
ncbi:MAG: MFS transporter [Acidobacteria bacterium]|nr:MFS transporter [Acidobacteriota bacterium]MBI3423721.1 MFS transporter [Acidobacteriota bacterium]